MPVDLHEESGGKVLVVLLTGKLTAQDYQHFTPEVERLIREHGKIRVVVEMHDFHGWDLEALWKDVQFDWKHFADIERLALVGDKKWEAGMAAFCKPFTKAQLRYFDLSQADEARAWVQADLPAVQHA